MDSAPTEKRGIGGSLVAFATKWRESIAIVVTPLVVALVQLRGSYDIGVGHTIGLILLTSASGGIGELPLTFIGKDRPRQSDISYLVLRASLCAAVIYGAYYIARADYVFSLLFPSGVGVGTLASVATVMARCETRSAWAGSATLRAARACSLTLAAVASAIVLGLTVAEALERVLARWFSNSSLEGAVLSAATISGILVGGAVLLAARNVWRLAARWQLSGQTTARAMYETTWLIALFAGAYPLLVSLLPKLMGQGWRSMHFMQLSVVAGALAGPVYAFICFAKTARRPQHASLLVVVPEPLPSRRVVSVAKKLVRLWQLGPVTLIAPPEAAPSLHGSHVALGRTAGLIETLFPEGAAELERYQSRLPAAFEWDALPKRECYPHAGIWGEALRLLATDPIAVVIIQEGFEDAPDDLDTESRLEDIMLHAAPEKQWLVSRYFAPTYAFERSTQYQLSDNFPTLARRVCAEISRGASKSASRHIEVFHEPRDHALAQALVAQLRVRRTSDGTLVSASRKNLCTRLYWLGRQLLFLLSPEPRAEQKDGMLPSWWRRLLLSYLERENADREVVLLERAPDERDEPNDDVIVHARVLSRLLDPVVVRLGRPFALGDSSTFGARKYAGYISEASTPLHVAEVAERLLERQTESIRPGAVAAIRTPRRTTNTRFRFFRPKVFICYRRREAAYAGRVSSALVEQLGSRNVIRDVTLLAPGDDFPNEIKSAIAGSDVVIAIIGRDWEGGDSQMNRLANPEDWVRMELELAFTDRIRVVPVLVGGRESLSRAGLPQSLSKLADIHGVSVRDADFDHDISQLLRAIGYRAWHRNSVRFALPIAALFLGGAFPGYRYFQLREWDAVLVANFTQGQWDAAEVAADHVLVLDPKNVRALSAKGSAAALSSQFRTAVKYFQQAYDLDPTNRVTRRNLAYALLHSGRADDAVKLYEGLRDGSAGAEYSVACAYTGAKRYADALRILEALPSAQADPGDKNPKGQPAVLEAAVLLALDPIQNRERALARLRFGIAQNPDYWPAILEKKTTDPQNDYTDQLALLAPILNDAIAKAPVVVEPP